MLYSKLGDIFMFNYFFISTTKLVLAIIIATCIVGVGVFLFVFFAKNRHVKKQVNDLSKKYDDLHNLLVIQLDSDLKRVYNISQLNVEYEAIYNMNMNMYNEVLAQEDTNAQEAINELNKLLLEKKYKQIIEEIPDVRIKVNELEDKCNKVSKSVNDIINTDDDNRQEILRYRREFREIKDNFESKRNELKYIESSFIQVFDKIESYFSEAETLLAGAHYEESKEKFPEIEHVIEALGKELDTLPKLTTLSFVVMPNNIEELTKRYNSLLEQGYPLHHLKFQPTIDSFNLALDKIQKKLTQFQTKNIEFELNQIRDGLITLGSDFDKEENARKYYKDEFDKIYNGSYKIENKFIKLRRSIPEYKVTYLLKENCVDSLENIQKEINELGTIKRTLDTYVHSSSQQPFSTLANKLKDLSDAMTQIETDIENMHKYLNSLRDDTNAGYEYITKTFVKLKNYESTLRKINVQSVTLSFNNDFKQCYQILSDCGDIINNLPIDVVSLNNNIALLQDCFDNIENRVNVLPNLVRKAEESIVYANQYRQAFDDVKTTLNRAEKSFFEGDFVRTTDETVAMLKKIKPETGK